MAREEIRIDIVAKDQASAALEDVADDAAALEKASPEVTVTVDDGATADLSNIRGEAKQTGESLEDVGRKAQSGSGNTVNAVRDLSGPLGEVSSQVGDMGESFVAAGEIATQTLGLSEETAAKLAGALPLVGLAIGAATAAWSMFRQGQQKAREEAEKLLGIQKDLNDALKEGDPQAAAEKFVEGYGDAVDAANELGLAVADVTKFVTGQTDALAGVTDSFGTAGIAQFKYQKEVVAARDAYAKSNEELERTEENTGKVADGFGGMSDAADDLVAAQIRAGNDADNLRQTISELVWEVIHATDAFDRFKGAIEMEASYLGAVSNADALAGSLEELVRLQIEGKASTEEIADAQRTAAEVTNRLRQTVVDLVEQYGTIPEEEKTKILAELPEAERAAWDAWMREVETTHTATLDVDTGPAQRALEDLNRRVLNLNPFARGGATTNVTVNMPRGAHGDDVVAAMNRHARRNGAA